MTSSEDDVGLRVGECGAPVPRSVLPRLLQPLTVPDRSPLKVANGGMHAPAAGMITTRFTFSFQLERLVPVVFRTLMVDDLLRLGSLGANSCDEHTNRREQGKPDDRTFDRNKMSSFKPLDLALQWL